jgi:hypothetical protein
MSNLTVVQLGIDTIHPHPENPRVGDVSALRGSLQRFGQVKPIVVQKDSGNIIAGNHTWQAAKDEGWEEIAAVVLDVDDDTAKAYLLADNRLADKGEYDAEKLYAILESTLDLDGTGYDLDYVETLGDAVGANVSSSTDTGAVIKQRGEDKPDAKPTNGKPGKAAPAAPTEPLKDIVILMTVSKAQEFGAASRAIQQRFEASGQNPPELVPGRDPSWTVAASVYQLVMDAAKEDKA